MQKLRATKSTLSRNTLKKTSIYFDQAHNFLKKRTICNLVEKNL